MYTYTNTIDTQARTIKGIYILTCTSLSSYLFPEEILVCSSGVNRRYDIT